MVKAGTVEGYVFDGYLSTLKTPNPEVRNGFFNYLKQNLSVKEVIEKVENHEVGNNRIVFEKGIFYEDNAHEGAYDFYVVFARLSLEEGFLICNYFFGDVINITRPDKETVIFLDEMGGVTMKYIKQTIILHGGWSC